jgi:hypothetical protein
MLNERQLSAISVSKGGFLLPASHTWSGGGVIHSSGTKNSNWPTTEFQTETLPAHDVRRFSLEIGASISLSEKRNLCYRSFNRLRRTRVNWPRTRALRVGSRGQKFGEGQLGFGGLVTH